MDQIQNKVKKLDEYQWPQGFFSDGIHAGLREGLDLGWIYSETPAAAVGVYTTSQFQAAPTKLTKNTINLNHQLQAVVMNSVCANSCTGPQGEADALVMQQAVADKMTIDSNLVGVASTGVIGQFMPMGLITAGIKKLELGDSDKVAHAVMTTDSHAKTISVAADIDGETVIVSGFCKGSGMIHPNMATMLGFVTTDAKIASYELQALLSEHVNDTFNQITVDGDTSTNDMVTVMANGASGVDVAASDEFEAAFHQVLSYLAQEIAADGEGATKLVEANIKHAETKEDAQKIAKQIVGSNLVKSAIFGDDANWGRIMGAIGQTDAKLDVDHVSLWINGIQLVKDSISVNFDEAVVKETLASSKVVIDVDVNVGEASGQAWGCDLTYDYVKINASYRS